MTQGTVMPPPPPPPPMAPSVPGAATGSLVCGIGSLVVALGSLCCGLLPLVGLALAVVALVLARMADQAIAASGGLLGGADQVKAGRITGYIGLALNALMLIFMMVIVIFYIGMAALGPRHW